MPCLMFIVQWTEGSQLFLQMTWKIKVLQKIICLHFVLFFLPFNVCWVPTCSPVRLLVRANCVLCSLMFLLLKEEQLMLFESTHYPDEHLDIFFWFCIDYHFFTQIYYSKLVIYKYLNCYKHFNKEFCKCFW